MFDLGWSEMLVIAVVLIVVVGPKDLPKMLRTFGKTTSSLRRMAGDFRRQFDDALKEAELDDIKSTIDGARRINPASEIRKALNPLEQAAQDVRSGLDDTLKPRAPKVPDAGEPAVPAEPLKSGPTAMPGESGAAKAAASPPAETAKAKSSAVSKAVKSSAVTKPSTKGKAGAVASARKKPTTKTEAKT